MKNNHRIIFMGSPKISSEYLQTLITNNFNVIGVYTQPPRPRGRGMNIQNSPVHEKAISLNLPVYHPENLKDQKNIDTFIKLNPDLVVVMAYGILLPEKILYLSKFGCINIHVSLLPRWRGAAPVEHALLNGDKETGITIFKLIKKLDAGPILSQSSLSIDYNTDREHLLQKLNSIGKDLLIKTLPNYLNNKISLQEQNEEKATYANKISSIQTKIDFNNNVIKVSNKIKAFSPKPGAWFMFRNERIKIIQCQTSIQNCTPSVIINNEFHIGCEGGLIKPRIIQREGKKPMVIGEFLKGFKFSVGQKVNA